MIKVFKLKYIIVILTVIALFFSIASFSINDSFASKASPPISTTIVLDAGHGGIDPGSVGKTTKTTESELNLKITLKLADYLKAGGFNVILTRTNADGLYGTYSKDYKKRDMQARKDKILNENAELVISIHINSFTNSSYRGAQVFYAQNNPESEKMASFVQQEFSKAIPKSDKGISIGDYYILKCTNIPTILCECGYLSNAEDEKLLIDETHQDKLAYSIYKGIVIYLNIGNHSA